jgi:hypothetical protein
VWGSFALRDDVTQLGQPDVVIADARFARRQWRTRPPSSSERSRRRAGSFNTAKAAG